MRLPELYAINPFSVLSGQQRGEERVLEGEKLAEERASSLVHTLVHEPTHKSVSGHTEKFTIQLHKLCQRLTRRELATIEDGLIYHYQTHEQQVNRVGRAAEAAFEDEGKFEDVLSDASRNRKLPEQQREEDVPATSQRAERREQVAQSANRRGQAA